MERKLSSKEMVPMEFGEDKHLYALAWAVYSPLFIRGDKVILPSLVTCYFHDSSSFSFYFRRAVIKEVLTLSF